MAILPPLKDVTARSAQQKGLQGLDREGPENEAGGREVTSASNVVRLPRDWLGPREDLIPFGAGAHRAAVDDDAGAGATNDPPFTAPPSANDFWGEHSEALHDAVQGPATIDGAALVDETAELHGADGGHVPASAAGGRIRLAGPHWQATRPAALAAAGIAAAAILLAVVLGAASSPSPSPGSSDREPRSSLLSNVGSAAATPLAVVRRMHVAAPDVAAHDRAAAGRAHRRAPTSSSRRLRAHPHASHASSPGSASASPTSPTPVTYSPPAAPPPSTASTTTSNGADGVRNEPTATAVKASAPHRSPVSPTGASGALGPVQSPNG